MQTLLRNFWLHTFALGSNEWQHCNSRRIHFNGSNIFSVLHEEWREFFHLTVRYNHYDAFLYLVHIFNDTNIFHCPDQYGNTILHIAASGSHHQVRNENDIAGQREPKKKKKKMQSQHSVPVTPFHVLQLFVLFFVVFGTKLPFIVWIVGFSLV